MLQKKIETKTLKLYPKCWIWGIKFYEKSL